MNTKKVRLIPLVVRIFIVIGITIWYLLYSFSGLGIVIFLKRFFVLRNLLKSSQELSALEINHFE